MVEHTSRSVHEVLTMHASCEADGCHFGTCALQKQALGAVSLTLQPTQCVSTPHFIRLMRLVIQICCSEAHTAAIPTNTAQRRPSASAAIRTNKPRARRDPQ